MQKLIGHTSDEGGGGLAPIGRRGRPTCFMEGKTEYACRIQLSMRISILLFWNWSEVALAGEAIIKVLSIDVCICLLFYFELNTTVV
jgi:hypothetical protein